MGAWIGALVLGTLAIRFWMRRLGRERTWDALQLFAPLLDLTGTWAGALAAIALWFGRVGFGGCWAGALGLVALMVTASLYDRAVLMPSLEAAHKRLGAAGDEKWERDWAFLWRMAGGARLATLLMGVSALVLGWYA